MIDSLMSDLKERMEKSVNALANELAGIRTGRASAALLDPIKVDAYGSLMPLNQLASVSCPEPRTLSVQVWDATMVQAVEKAIRDSDLGLNPMSEGQVIRIHLPDLSAERRKELAKLAHKYAEQGKVAIRNIRKDGMDAVKKMEKDSEISEDEMHSIFDDIQKLTDQYTKKMNDMAEAKEKDITSV